VKVLSSLFLLLSISTAHTRPIEVKVRDYGWLTSFPALRDVLDFYLQGVENDLNEEQSILNPARVNYGTANSSVIAPKGLGTDYVNNPQKYQVSLGVGVAWDDERDVALRDDISGAAAASSVTIGRRLNDKVMIYVNFGTFDYSRNIPSGDFDIAGDLKSTNLGIHLRYDLIESRRNEGVSWGGVKVHAGYEYNSNTVDLISDIKEKLEVDIGGAGRLEGVLIGKPILEVTTRTHSIPLEISTSVFFLRAVSLYGGFGIDMNYGQSKGEGDVKGDVATLACTSGVCVGETVIPQLEVQANYDAVSEIRTVTLRGFLGLQVDLPQGLHAFAQAQKMFGTEVLGVSGGMTYSF
jgi:hypothetical protein